MKAKLKRTLYFDYWAALWDWDKPDGDYGQDYSLLRTGSIFKVYHTPEELKEIIDELDLNEFAMQGCHIILADKKGNWFGYRNWDELEETGFWEVWDK